MDRPRLDGVLDQVEDYPLTLICAPPGSGKSVAAGAWAERRRGTAPVAWLTCKSLGQDQDAFWRSALRALAQATDSPAADSTLLRSRTPLSRSELLTRLVSWLSELPAGTTLICDDFAEVGAAATQTELQQLSDRLPDQIHLMIISRLYPPLAVHRARLEGRLLDVRASDLAFTRAETTALLSAHGLQVDAPDLDLLQQRTEGWAAGVRLAVMSMTQASEPAEVIHRLADSTDVVSGYLTEQVLAQLSPADRSFLLDCCVVDEFRSDLATALTEQPSSEHHLELTADRIGFLHRATRAGDTYRFHPLFAELVRSELVHSDPDRFRRQHRRASRWYEICGEPVEAARHAQRGEDWDRAARQLALNFVSLILRGRMEDVVELLNAFPQDSLAEDPRLALVQSMSMILDNDPLRARMLLARARAGLPSRGDLDSRRFAALGAYVAAVIARYSGDSAEALAALHPEGPDIPGPDDSGFDRRDLDLRAAWRSTRAVSLMWEDQPAAAIAEAARASADVRSGAAPWPMAPALGAQAFLSALDGHLTEADRLLDEMTAYVNPRQHLNTPFAAVANLADGWVAMERGQIDRAEEILRRNDGMRPRISDSAPGAATRILRARILLLHGDPWKASELLDSVFERGPRERNVLLERLRAWVRVEIWLSRGDVGYAAEVARDGSRALRAYVSARAGEAPEADVAWDDHDLGLQLRTLLIYAINLHQTGRLEGADQCLDAALDLTAAEGYRLPFLQLGGRTHALLVDAHVAAAHHGSLVAELLGTTAPPAGLGVELTDPLSPRELEVLRHLVVGLDTDEIAGGLFVSRNTVRTHTKSIYRKLAVQNKRQAVLRAAALGIV